MTDILPWLIANWPMLAIALAALIFLIAGVSWAITWYLWQWVIEAHTEPAPWQEYVFGDVPHVPKEARRDAA